MAVIRPSKMNKPQNDVLDQKRTQCADAAFNFLKTDELGEYFNACSLVVLDNGDGFTLTVNKRLHFLGRSYAYGDRVQFDSSANMV